MTARIIDRLNPVNNTVESAKGRAGISAVE
jgi:hypothetical protein